VEVQADGGFDTTANPGFRDDHAQLGARRDPGEDLELGDVLTGVRIEVAQEDALEQSSGYVAWGWRAAAELLDELAQTLRVVSRADRAARTRETSDGDVKDTEERSERLLVVELDLEGIRRVQEQLAVTADQHVEHTAGLLEDRDGDVASATEIIELVLLLVLRSSRAGVIDLILGGA
jgi:hypothetical protein